LGNLDRTDLPNGVIEDYVYDDLNRLDVLTHYAPDATPEDLSDNDKLAEFDYTVRADGKRTAATETFWLDEDSDPQTPATPHVNEINWTYDDIGRLTDEVFNHFDDTLDQTESFVYDLVGNRKLFTKDKGNDSIVDEAITYLYDVNDRLVTESLDSDNDGATDQTTTYGYDHTQQTSKSVTDALDSTLSTLSYSYDLQGRMAEVITETFTDNVVTRRERVTYEYDSKGIRISALHEVDSEADGAYETRTCTEYLVDHHNFTGYQQVIKETEYDEVTGKVKKVVEYTIGHDEIAQTTTEFDADGNVLSEQTLVFGHDGHGSVRVLYDMAAAIVQIYAYDAYGNPLGFNPATALTNLLYSGEQFDQQIAMQYL